MDQQRSVHSGCSSQASSGNVHPLYRHQCLGLGCSSETGGTIVTRSLDKRPIRTPYQCPGNNGYFHGSGKSTSCNPQHDCHDCDRQGVNGVVYHKTGGRGTHSPTLCMEVWNLLLWCHQRGITLKIRHIPPGRPSLKNVETCSNWMVSHSDNSQSGLFNDGVSQQRSIWDSSQQKTSNVCVTYSRQQSSDNRRTVSQLGSYPRIYISPVSHHSCHSEQDSSVSVQDCPSTSFMASKVMVSGSTATSSCSSLKTPQHSRPSGSTRKETYASKPSNACPSHLGIIKLSVTDKKWKLQNTSVQQEDFLLMQNGQSSLIGVLKGTLILSWPLPGGARWLSGRVSDSRARGPGFETYRRRVVSLSKTLYSPKVLVNYPGSDGSVPTWLKNCWLGR